MSLTPGERLGPYEIAAPIGAGGMGQVYRAVDTRLGRQVAIKVLPPEFAVDPERLSRFEQEARAAAALNHPHIAALYDVGVQGHTQYIVQEYLDGVSLRERLDERRDRQIAAWLPIAAQIASALATAHQTGIVHRDLKPENVMVSPDGHAKVLDFGLAKLIEPTGAGAVNANSPTALGTMAGAVLGTVGYLAPEQAAGLPVDRRADIFSLGCILYEMAAGERPFGGRSVAEMIAHVLHDDPRPLADIKPNTPLEFQRIVGKCLAKDPTRRYQHADDLSLDLRDLAARPVSTSTLPTGEPARAGGAARWVWPVASTALAVLAVWGWMKPRPEAEPQPASRLAIVVPNYGGASTAIQRQIAITPDGSTLLFPAIAADGENRTMRLTLNETEPSPLPGVVPFLGDYVMSTDGREFLGTLSQSRQLFRYSIAGGNPRQLPQEIQMTAHAAWSDDGSIWFRSVNEDVGLVQLTADGRVSKRFGKEHFGLAPMCILPGGRSAIVVRTPFGVSSGPAFLLDLTTGQLSPLIDRDIVEVRYTSGYLVYAIADGTLYASPFDSSSGRVSGVPVILAKGVAIGGNNTAQFAVARNGTVVYIPEEPRSLVLIGRDGSIRPATPAKQNFHAPMFSPDGRRIALDFNAPDGRDVWVLSLADGLLSRATFDRDGHDAVWTPDGRALSYTSLRKGLVTLMRTRPGESQTSDVLLSSAQLGYGGVWMPDASALITVANSREAGSDLAWVRSAGKGPIEPLQASRFDEGYPAVSPDGRWLAFVSNQSGQNQVYVRSLAGAGDQVQISLAGGTEPGWSRDGPELYYRTGAGLGSEFIAASLGLGAAIEVKARRTLFPVADMVTATPHRNWDVSPDGRSFAMVRFNPATRIMVIQQLAAAVEKLPVAAR